MLEKFEFEGVEVRLNKINFITGKSGIGKDYFLNKIHDENTSQSEFWGYRDEIKRGKISEGKQFLNILLFRRIEDGLHYSEMHERLKWLFDYFLSRDIQIIAVTQSYEMIEAAYEVTKGKGIFSLHRFKRDDDGNLKVVTYDEEDLGTSIKLGWEIR